MQNSKIFEALKNFQESLVRNKYDSVIGLTHDNRQIIVYHNDEDNFPEKGVWDGFIIKYINWSKPVMVAVKIKEGCNRTWLAEIEEGDPVGTVFRGIYLTANEAINATEDYCRTMNYKIIYSEVKDSNGRLLGTISTFLKGAKPQ